jgi:large subunit ribosomal protein L15
MQQHQLRQPDGATHKRKRVGRGNASGHGTYSTKGLKGQKARSGGGVRPGFEGGQLPFVRRMARKRGFTNAFRIDYDEVNVCRLAKFTAGTEQALLAARLIRGGRPVKILGVGDLSVALTVEATRFSASAKAKIEAAGGTLRWLDGEPEPRAAAPAPEAKPKRARAAKSEKAPQAEGTEQAKTPGGSAEEQGEASDGAGS